MSKYLLTLGVINGKIKMKAKSDKASVGDLSLAYVQLEIAKRGILKQIFDASNPKKD